VLLIEDNPTDAELCMEALKEFNLYNAIVWVKDGAEALDFLFARGAYANRNTSPPPRSCCWICACPKSTAWKCCR
jgi:two-component system, response regulator